HPITTGAATITQLNDLANSHNTSATNIDAKVSDTTADRERGSQLAQQAKASIDGIKTVFDSQLKPQLNDISDSI
ncbi:YhgE/Pip domain-containing protein, partial [Bifidobacterium pseudocatenulatum]|nr:YhgE/Pip domain-containing protein [Bifidobacterium pseudocatenulatum]